MYYSARSLILSMGNKISPLADYEGSSIMSKGVVMRQKPIGDRHFTTIAMAPGTAKSTLDVGNQTSLPIKLVGEGRLTILKPPPLRVRLPQGMSSPLYHQIRK